MLIMTFSVSLGWLPASGRATVELLGLQWSWLTADGWRHLILPAFNLSLFKISLVIRLTRAGVRDVLPQDYVKFARAKGLSPVRVVGVHVLRNTMIPLVTVLGLELGSTIAFAVVTESIFAWPGAGKLILDSLNALDRPVIVAYLIVVVCLFVTLNLIVDILYKVLDPRVRLEARHERGIDPYPDPDARPAPRIPWRRNLAEFLSSKTAVVGLAVSLLLILAAALALDRAAESL